MRNKHTLLVIYAILIIATITLVLVVVRPSKYIHTREVKVQEVYKNFPNKYVGEFSITHYCSCPKCTGTPMNSKTATGHIPREGRTIAVDKRVIPLHSIVYIEGLGFFVAEDVGGAVKQNHIDVYVGNHEEALKLGNLQGKKKKVYIMG